MSNKLPFGHVPVTERDFDLPDGENVAVWVAPNVEFFEFGVPGLPLYPAAAENTPDVMNYSWRDYGTRVGIWRIADVLDEHGIRASAPINADVLDHYQAVVDAAMERNWEIIGHGTTNSQPLSDVDNSEEEREIIEATRNRIAAATGEAPTGWLGPELAETFDTPDLLAAAGFEYVCDWVNDDQPYSMALEDGRLASVPYALETGDIAAFLLHGMTAPQYERMLVDQFDVLYEEGAETGNAKVMCISIHPFLIGQPHRIGALDRALSHVADHEDVWLTTAGEIAAHYHEEYRTV